MFDGFVFWRCSEIHSQMVCHKGSIQEYVLSMIFHDGHVVIFKSSIRERCCLIREAPSVCEVMSLGVFVKPIFQSTHVRVAHHEYKDFKLI